VIRVYGAQLTFIFDGNRFFLLKIQIDMFYSFCVKSLFLIITKYTEPDRVKIKKLVVLYVRQTEKLKN